MNKRILAEEVWKSFSQKAGSRYIATKTAIQGLIKWLDREKPTSVLEIGAGIGTLTFTTIETLNRRRQSDYNFVSLEDNDYCRGELDVNLGAGRDRVQIVEDIARIPECFGNFDFLILDGGDHQDSTLFSRLSDRALVFIEGGRRKQADTLEAVIGSTPYVEAVVRTARCKHRIDDKCTWEKGYRVYKRNPSLYHKLLFRYLNLREKLRFRIRPYVYFHCPSNKIVFTLGPR